MLKKTLSVLMCLVLTLMLVLPAAATDFTPSVSGKDAPDIVPVVGPDGREYSGIIYDKDGNVVAYVPASNIIITPISAAEDAEEEIRERLEAAFEELTNTDDLSPICDSLDEALDEISEDLMPDDLVVRDLFDVHVTGEYADFLAEEGNYLMITFDLEADSMLLAAVLRYLQDSGWEAVYGTNLFRDGNKVTIAIYNVGPVAFFFDNGALDVDPDGPTSPETGIENDLTAAYLTVGALALALCAAVVLFRKRAAA